MINKTVSYYNNADDSKSKIRYNLDYVLGMIRDNQELFQQTVRVRSMPTEEEYKQAKKSLPMIAPSGVFDYRNISGNIPMCWFWILTISKATLMPENSRET